MRAMVMLVLVWAIVISATPGLVDRFITGSSPMPQPVVLRSNAIAPAPMRQSVTISRVAIRRSACRGNGDARMILAADDGPNSTCSVASPAQPDL